MQLTTIWKRAERHEVHQQLPRVKNNNNNNNDRLTAFDPGQPG